MEFRVSRQVESERAADMQEAYQRLIIRGHREGNGKKQNRNPTKMSSK